MTLQEYVDNLNKQYRTGRAREHSYRSDLQTLLSTLLPQILVTNEPSRSEVGAPDYILTKGNIPVGYIEAKDIDDGDLDGKKKNKEQFSRYKSGLPNLVFTDYLDFHFYKDGELTTTVRIAEAVDGVIVAKSENFETFEHLIKDFAQQVSQTIRSSARLSKMMAGKARILADVIEKALNVDEESQKNQVNSAANNTLREQLTAFQNVLINDIKPKEFGDIYAQTIAYGMFAARLHDPTLETFSRQEAAELIPKSNPFLRKLFQYIAGYDLDDRIIWIVDGLADIFRATDVDGLLKNFGKSTQQNDPIIHFYETFLAEYDPKLRKSRGVWYTPEPVVNFIVRAVDDILKDEFGLKDGLADTSKTKIKVKVPTHDKRHKEGMVEEEREVHRVQILDPAAGTGTFLAEVIKQIYAKFEGQQGIWTKYVEQHLIPRLNGFEILMASYAMAHLKLDLLLQETGYNASASGATNQRFKIYLTNSLEEHHPDSGTLFANWLSEEANEANHIKRDTPVMVVMGNPPYSGVSSNMGKWISELIEDYKYVDGEHFGERKHWLHDDYVKFLRYGQYLVDKNGEGVLAFISNHSFIDNPTFRGMRWNLLKSFDKIYILDLHGNSIRKEVTPEGEKDENVFDITAGVSINLFIKNKDASNTDLAEILEYDLWGMRNSKYEFLSSNSLNKVAFKKINPIEPYFFFRSKDNATRSVYEKGILLSDLFTNNSMGITTARDQFIIDISKESLSSRVKDFCNKEISDQEFQNKYSLNENYQWKISEQRKLIPEFDSENIIKIDYRIFDVQYIYYQENLVFRDRRNIMKHLFYDNYALNLSKRGRKEDQHNYFVSNKITDKSISSSLDNTNTFPLYLYPEESGQQTLDGKPERVPNLDKKILKDIEKKLGLKFVAEKEDTEGTFAPIDLLDYIYAVLHSPAYREKYKEFLKIDFPRVPYPEDSQKFWELVELGGELRQIHLLEADIVEKPITTYPIDGDNMVRNRITKNDPGFVPHTDEPDLGKVVINESQYFDNVPLTAWEFYIGGYQPAQKWLKDRRDRELSIDDIKHYQKIIVALTETDRIMKGIDEIGVIELAE